MLTFILFSPFLWANTFYKIILERGKLAVPNNASPLFERMVVALLHHNLLNIWNKFQLINNCCFYFELWALLNCPTSVLEWSHVRVPKPNNQANFGILIGACQLDRFLLFPHEISNSVHFATKFSVPVCFFLVHLLESSKLRQNLRRCSRSRSRRASWTCILHGVVNA